MSPGKTMLVTLSLMIPVAIAYLNIPYINVFVNFCLLLVLLVAVFWLAILIVAFSYHRLNNILMRDCDPVCYNKKYRAMLVSPFASRKYILITRLNLCTGLRAAGLFDEAIGILNAIPAPPKSAKLKALYLMNVMALQVWEKNLTAYHQTLLTLEALAAKIPPQWQNELAAVRMLESIDDGNFEEAESFFSERFASAPHNYARVSAQYALGLIYARTGQSDKAGDALSYVVAHGNKLYLVRLAQQQQSLLNTTATPQTTSAQ